VRRIAALAAAALLIAAPARADGEVDIDSVDASEAPNVSVVVSVLGSPTGNGYGADDFAVVVDGTRVPADVYAAVRDPIEVVVAIDTSGSMDGDALATARTAAIGFVDRLPASAQVAVVSFGDEVVTHTAIGTPRSEATAAIAGLSARGETALYDAVIAGTGLFTAADARRVLVVLSDGGDTVSTATLAEAIAAAANEGVEVRPVALATSESDTEALASLAAPGSVTTATNAAGLADAYESVARELTGTYRLAFEVPGSGTATISVYVNTPDGVLAASRVVDIVTGTVVGSLIPEPAPPGFAAQATPHVTEAATPIGLSSPWTLPAGVTLVFLGAVLAFWLTSRTGDSESPPPLAGLEEPVAERRGFLASLGGTARAIGDRIATRPGRRSNSIDQALDRAGVALRPGEFVVIAATVVVVGVTLGLVVAGIAGAIIFGSAGVLGPRLVLRLRTDRRRRAFGDQLEGTLQTIAGSLRAGYGLVQAMNTVAAEAPSPTSEEFNRVVVENRLGRPVEHSMEAMAQRLENEDLGWVVEAIEIQHEVGGNLAEVLDTVTGTIRDRNQIRRQIKALSAEGRISAFILLALPFVIAAFIAMVAPDYLSELTDSAPGRIMLVVAAILMLAGGAWIRRIIRVRF
jgi:tight adherence protein B